MRAISIERVRRTVIEATTSSRASFSFTRLRRMSRSSAAMAYSPGWDPLLPADGAGLKMAGGGSVDEAALYDALVGRKLRAMPLPTCRTSCVATKLPADDVVLGASPRTLPK